jgi:Domain of unknown function (DUF5615)
MRFLIDANMPRSAAELLKYYKHEAVDVRDIGMGATADSDIAIYAQQNGLAIVTRDFDFADIRNYPPSQICWTLGIGTAGRCSGYVRGASAGVISCEQRTYRSFARSPRNRRTGTRASATASEVMGAILRSLVVDRPICSSWQLPHGRPVRFENSKGIGCFSRNGLSNKIATIGI